MGRPKVVQDGVRVEALLSREEHEYVKKFAEATGLSVSAVLRLFVTKSLEPFRDYFGDVPSVQAMSAAYQLALVKALAEKENSNG